jgi:arginase
MPPQPLTSLSLITVPYHVGLRASPIHRSRVSEGPDYLKKSGGGGGLLSLLQKQYRLPVHELEIPPVQDDFEGEIGRTFELIRRVALAVTAARDAASFPIVLAGNCCISVGVAAGLSGSAELRGRGAGEADGEDGLGCVWFDAHDDYNVPDSMVSGYFDSQGIAMMAGECWKGLMATVPGFSAVVVEEGGPLRDEGCE